MSNTLTAKPPVWFWVVVVIAIVWNLIGVYAYIADVTMSPETIAEYSQAEQDLLEARPSWLFGAYAIAVFAALIGSVGLALRQGWSVPFFGVSLAAVIVQMAYVLFVMKAISILGAGAAMFPAIITVIAAFLLWFSMHVRGKGWFS